MEQERTKYQFFASMSKEIQFEYYYQSDQLTISDWGAEHLGIGVFIANPQEDTGLGAVFFQKDYLDFQKRIRVATQENPMIERTYCLNVKGKQRWYKAVGGLYEGFEIQASMGIALAPRDGTTYEELFYRADQALYAAKQEGQKGHRYYNDSMADLLSVLSPVEGETQEKEMGESFIEESDS